MTISGDCLFYQVWLKFQASVLKILQTNTLYFILYSLFLYYLLRSKQHSFLKGLIKTQQYEERAKQSWI